MEQLLTELKHFGLSDKEALVYLAGLELGPAPVQDISHKAKVNRATTYVMIESLSSRGIMSTFVRGKKRFYVAENPDRLISILHLQQKALEDKHTDLIKMLPMLTALYNAEGAKPQIRYLEGVEGLRAMRETLEKTEGEALQILQMDDALASEELSHERQAHVSNIKLNQTKHRIIAVTKDPNIITHEHDLGVGEWRMVPADEFPLHGEITVRGNHVFLFSYRSAILSVVISSKEIADAVRALFELAWKGAAGYPSKKFG